MGHAYHAEYLVWFECARTELLRSLGTSYRQWEEVEGVFLPVTQCEVRFHQPVLYDDLIMIETNVTRLTRASISFEYRLFRMGASETLAMGSTSHAFINGDGRVIRVADRLLAGLF
jgi:acyl-CoA thioester hydrolase